MWLGAMDENIATGNLKSLPLTRLFAAAGLPGH
jgi:hypothetical protein